MGCHCSAHTCKGPTHKSMNPSPFLTKWECVIPIDSTLFFILAMPHPHDLVAPLPSPLSHVPRGSAPATPAC